MTQPPVEPPQYGAPPPSAATYAGPPLAGWGDRVVAALIDYFIPGVVYVIAIRISVGLGLVLLAVGLAWTIYNKVLEGRTGQSYGKQIAKTKLISEQTGQPVGPGLAIGRWLLHIVDGLPCYLGYLWPLWDAKKQTFADKLVHTVVVKTG
jgi:uncharacterized RDD family membrane protein YckC